MHCASDWCPAATLWIPAFEEAILGLTLLYISTASLVNKIIYLTRKCVSAPTVLWCRVMSVSHGEAIHLCIYGFNVLWPGQGKQIPLSQRCTLWTTGVMFPSRYPSFPTVKQHPSLNLGNKRFTASCSPFINLLKNLNVDFSPIFL